MVHVRSLCWACTWLVWVYDWWPPMLIAANVQRYIKPYKQKVGKYVQSLALQCIVVDVITRSGLLATLPVLNYENLLLFSTWREMPLQASEWPCQYLGMYIALVSSFLETTCMCTYIWPLYMLLPYHMYYLSSVLEDHCQLSSLLCIVEHSRIQRYTYWNKFLMRSYHTVCIKC